MTEATPGFTLVREFDATPEELWHYWTDPSEASHWLHPRGVSTPAETVRIDAREGGSYEYVMVDDTTGERYPTVGEYREVVPYRRLAFTWGSPGDDPEDCPLITVTFEPLSDRTRMTFDLRGFPGSAGDGYVYDGWSEAFDHLGAHLVSEAERP